MKKVKCEIEFEVADDITEFQVEAYLWDTVGGMQLGEGIGNEARNSIEDTAWGSEHFDVDNVKLSKIEEE